MARAALILHKKGRNAQGDYPSDDNSNCAQDRHLRDDGCTPEDEYPGDGVREEVSD